MPSFKRNRELEKEAAALYSKTLPYHNFGHALQTIAAGEKLVGEYAASGLEMNWEVIYYSLLFHDAGFHEDHRRKGFQSKEEYSAKLAEDVLTKSGVEKALIEKVKQTILCTERDAVCRNNEEKVVRTADLSNIGSDYNHFRHDTEQLKKEHELITGAPVPWEEWLEEVSKTIEYYLSQDFRLSRSGKVDSNHSFQENARNNLSRLLKEFT